MRLACTCLGFAVILGPMGVAILNGAEKRLEALVLRGSRMPGLISQSASERRVSTSVNLWK